MAATHAIMWSNVSNNVVDFLHHKVAYNLRLYPGQKLAKITANNGLHLHDFGNLT